MWPVPVENLDVVDVGDAASVKLECGFVRELTVEMFEKGVTHPFVGAVANQLVVACAADESCDPVSALDVSGELGIDIRRSFEDSQHLLVFFDAAVDVGVAAFDLLESFVFIDHVLKQ